MAKTSTRNGARTLQIAEELRQSIVRGELAPGTVLRQEDLAKRFETSRTPIRDSLRLLERQGLVSVPTNKGAEVTPLNADDFAEISEMRALAEPLALRHAVPNLTNRHLEVAERIQAKAETASVETLSDLNKAFHASLVAPCNRPRLLAHLASLSDLNERYLSYAVTTLDYMARSHEEHRELLQACFARNADQACSLLEQHINDAKNSLLARMQDARAVIHDGGDDICPS
ncbi:GntR family transcriptional regulator [uncultured Tateyamaria sp.]|uniref:GntR family transcriptional regulator n=1 Tax=uncultured Tateyamaria sp. TaxID=455651 RepID=UPI002638D8EA|nr:GntR family transcriptional regulator [uncultured Tateyamaria sp.]